jgi:hypothetical protein
MQNSHIQRQWEWHACTDFGSRRGKVMERKKNGFGTIIAETRGACVITIIWLGQKVGHKQDGLKG